MKIDITSLNQDLVNSLEIDEYVSFESEDIKNLGVESMEDFHVTGTITKTLENAINLDLNLTGNLYLNDSVSLETVKYPVSCEIHEKILENFENTLDILDILWQNIVLEVPIRFTEVENYDEYQGKGWRLISDEAQTNNNPFEEIKSLFGEE